MRERSVLALVAASLLALGPQVFLASGSSSDGCGFGSEYGGSMLPLLMGPSAPFGYFDANGDAMLGTSEHLLLDLDGGRTVSTADVWLDGPNSGLRPKASDLAFGQPLETLAAPVTYEDLNGDGARNATEPVLVDVDASGQVTIGDRYLAPASLAGQVHSASMQDEQAGLSSLGGAAAFVDQDNDTQPGATDLVLWDLGTTQSADPLDLCLTVAGAPSAPATTSAPAPAPVDPGKACSFGSSYAGTSGIPLMQAPTLRDIGFFDANGDAVANPTEPFYLDLDASGTVTSADARLSGDQVGTRPKASDLDFGRLISKPSGPLAFQDLNGDDLRGPTEAMLIDVDASGTVSVGDRYLAPGSRAGTTQTASGAALGAALAPMHGGITFMDRDNDAQPGPQEAVLWEGPQGEAGKTDTYDLCLSGPVAPPPSPDPGPAPPPGAALSCRYGDAPTNAASQPLIGGDGLAYVDANGNGRLDASEPLFADVDGSGTITTSDVRLDGAQAGKRPTASAADFGQVLTFLPSDVGYFDANGDAIRNHDEIVVLDVDASRTLTIGDRYLAPGAKAGSAVKASDLYLNQPLMALGGGTAFQDLDGDGVAAANEAVLWDASPLGTISGSDICLSGSPKGAAPTPHPQPVPTNANTPTAPCTIGHAIAADDPNLGWALEASAPQVGLLDRNGNAQADPGETLYLDVDGSGTITLPDVALTGTPGARPQASSAEFNNALLVASSLSWSYNDTNGDGQRQADEPIRLLAAFGGSAGAIWVAPTDMAGLDAPASGSFRPLGGRLAFQDDNGDAMPGPNEAILWDLDASDTRSVLDVCLSGAPPAPAHESTQWTDWKHFNAAEMAAPLAKEPATWVVAGALVASIVGFILRWKIMVQLVGLLPLFSRLQRHKLLDHPLRADIHSLVEADPGIHYQAIVRRLERGRGVIEYHLDRLVQGNLLRRHQQDGRILYFLAATGVPAQVGGLSVLREPGPRRLAREVQLLAHTTPLELSKRLALPTSTIHDMVRRLAARGVLSIERSGRTLNVGMTNAGRQALAAADPGDGRAGPQRNL